MEYRRTIGNNVPTLERAHKDLEQLHDHLVQYQHYPIQAITIMRDDAPEDIFYPTRDNIVRYYFLRSTFHAQQCSLSYAKSIVL